MPPVEQRRPPAGNPGASRYVRRRLYRRWRHGRHGAGANVVSAARARCGRARSAGSAARSGVEPRPGPDAGTADRSSGCPGRSGCTAPLGRDSARTGTGGLDSPCAPRQTEGAGRTRPKRSTLLWHRLHRHGVGRGAVVKLPGKERPLPCPPSSASTALYRGGPLRRPRLPGRPAGRPGRRTPHQNQDRPAGTVRLNQSCTKTAISPSNKGGS
jgi:hypothetical protein